MGVLRERGEIEDEVWSFFLSSQTKIAAGAAGAGALKLKSEPNGKTGITFYLYYNIVSVITFNFSNTVLSILIVNNCNVITKVMPISGRVKISMDKNLSGFLSVNGRTCWKRLKAWSP